MRNSKATTFIHISANMLFSAGNDADATELTYKQKCKMYLLSIWMFDGRHLRHNNCIFANFFFLFGVFECFCPTKWLATSLSLKTEEIYYIDVKFFANAWPHFRGNQTLSHFMLWKTCQIWNSNKGLIYEGCFLH